MLEEKRDEGEGNDQVTLPDHYKNIFNDIKGFNDSIRLNTLRTQLIQLWQEDARGQGNNFAWQNLKDALNKFKSLKIFYYLIRRCQGMWGLLVKYRREIGIDELIKKLFIDAVKNANVLDLKNLIGALDSQDYSLFIDSEVKEGRTLLLQAVLQGEWSVVSMLVKAGADLNAIDNSRQNILHMLVSGRYAQNQFIGFKALLVDFKASIQGLVFAEDESGRTPFDLALDAGKFVLANSLWQCTEEKLELDGYKMTSNFITGIFASKNDALVGEVKQKITNGKQQLTFTDLNWAYLIPHIRVEDFQWMLHHGLNPRMEIQGHSSLQTLRGLCLAEGRKDLAALLPDLKKVFGGTFLGAGCVVSASVLLAQPSYTADLDFDHTDLCVALLIVGVVLWDGALLYNDCGYKMAWKREGQKEGAQFTGVRL